MRVWILVALALFGVLSRSRSTMAQEAPTEVTTTSESTHQADLSSSAIERSSHAHVHINPTFKGFWTKKFAWRPRWVKTWQEKKVYVAVWKRMWGPVVTKEWVPVPKPPPGWVKHDAASYIVKQFPHH